MAKSIQICSLQLSQTDCIRLNGFPVKPENLIGPLQSAICTGWKKGISAQSDLHGATNFKLCGNPWSSDGGDGVAAKRLLVSILKCIAEEGWDLLQSCDLTTKLYDKDTMFFEYVGKKEPQVSMFAISFNRTDRIRLILLNDRIEESVVSTFTSELAAACPLGVDAIDNYHDATELKLKGNPWMTSNAKESIATKLFLCRFLHIYRSLGYKLYASVDVSMKGGKHCSDMESWVFRKVTDLWGK